MNFSEEKTGYEKTILSDLQGAWGCLGESVVKAFGFEGSDRAIFHIDEAMSPCIHSAQSVPVLFFLPIFGFSRSFSSLLR